MMPDYQAVVAGQAGNWGVAVRMLMPPAARGPRKPRSLRGRGEPHLRDETTEKRSTKIGMVAGKCREQTLLQVEARLTLLQA